MISDGTTYLAILLFVASTIVIVAKQSRAKLFDYLPPIVILYFLIMVLSTLGVWQKSEAITHTYKAVKSTLLPAMIFLMLLQADIRQITKLGKRMLFTFLLTSLSIAVGFLGMFGTMHTLLGEESWRAFAALCGSWMGGTGNMVAIQGALHLPDSQMGYVLLIDSIDYAIWVMVLLWLVPYAPRFNRWTQADTTQIDKIGERLLQNDTQQPSPPDFPSLFFLLGSALLVTALSHYGATLLPTTIALSHTSWQVILATIAGIVLAMTPLAKLSGAFELGTMMLYTIVALIASRASFGELTQAPLYIFAGFVIIVIHALLMLFFAKRFKLDLFSIGVASLANIGGVASAPILASAYHRVLIPIGVLMAMLGYIVGTFGGLAVGRLLAWIGGV